MSFVDYQQSKDFFNETIPWNIWDTKKISEVTEVEFFDKIHYNPGWIPKGREFNIRVITLYLRFKTSRERKFIEMVELLEQGVLWIHISGKVYYEFPLFLIEPENPNHWIRGNIKIPSGKLFSVDIKWGNKLHIEPNTFLSVVLSGGLERPVV